MNNSIDMDLIRRAAADVNGSSVMVSTATEKAQPAYIKSAVELARLGVPIELISANTKACTTPNWQTTCTTDADEIIRRFHQNLDKTNYAAVAQAKSGGNLFLDDDGGIRAAFEAEGGKMQPTLKVLSCSGNFHYYYKHSAKSLAFWQRIGRKASIKETSSDGTGELFSLRMDRAYVVGPSSVALNHQHIATEYKIAHRGDIIEIPDDLLDFLISRWQSAGNSLSDGKKPITSNTSNADLNTGITDPAVRQAAIAAACRTGEIAYGSHDTQLTKIGGKLRRIGLDEAEIYPLLVDICEAHCTGKGDDWKSMCEKISVSVCNYPKGMGNVLLWSTDADTSDDERNYDPSFQMKLNACAKEGKTIEEAAELSGFNQLVRESLEKVVTDTNADEKKSPITVFKGDDFIIENIPARKVLISTISANEPVIFEQSINQIFAWRGEGKTCLGLGFVRTLATAGQFLNFKASERHYVLYVEGELPDSQFQERWRSIVGETDGYAYGASLDKQPGHNFVSLASEIGMAKIEATLADLTKKGIQIKVLMLDNISTLFNVKANEEEVWIGIQSWFMSLRSRGITVFFFHHAGKGGLSRSHSKSEDALDVSIKLEAPDEPEPGHLHTVLTFDKARAGLSEKPAEVKLHRVHSEKCACRRMQMPLACPGDSVRWEWIPRANKRDEAYLMFANGASYSDVAHALAVPEGTVKTWRTKWGKLQQQDAARIKAKIQP